jgi:hypothetical protein
MFFALRQIILRKLDFCSATLICVVFASYPATLTCLFSTVEGLKHKSATIGIDINLPVNS